MTTEQLRPYVDDARHWAERAKDRAAEGDQAGCYTFMLLARESLHKGIRRYNAKQKQEAA